jgi:hypothetical protein
MKASRFPDVAPGAGHYESWFVKASHPTEPQAFWLRHTVHQRPGEAPTASVWLTLFDAAAPEPVRAGKATFAAPRATPDCHIAIGASELRPDGARGELASPTLDATWAFRFATGEPEQRHLPAAWMYDARLPRTKSGTPYPGATFSGIVGPFGIDGWRGLVSHNWGSEHAERWIWLHAPLDNDAGPGGGWLELVLGRIAVGPLRTPWIANGALSLGGVRHRLGGPRRIRGTRVEEEPTGARIAVAGDGGAVELAVEAPAEEFVCWRYADPRGPEHHSAHCSIADLTLDVRLADGRTVHAGGRAAYELGMRETDHGLPVQPYADGEASDHSPQASATRDEDGRP